MKRRLMPAMLLATLGLLCCDRAAAIELPAAEQILKTLKREHPRLLVSAKTFVELKQRITRGEQPYAKWYATVKGEADRTLDLPPSHYEIPDGRRLLSVSRRVLGRTYHLAMVYRIEGDAKYKDRLWREMETAAGFKDWNPSHFLDTAEMTHAFAIAYDWLYADWSDEQREVIRKAMIKMGLNAALDRYTGKRRRNWWAKTKNNWNQVCNGGIGIGALAIADEEPELAAKLLHYGLTGLPTAMKEFAPDGACVEGPGYWNYAIRYNVYFLAALNSALGTDFGYSEMAGFAEVGNFPIHMRGPSGQTFNFGDSRSGTVVASQMYWLAKRYDRPAYAQYQNRFARGEPHDLLWYDPSFGRIKTIEEPTGRYFRHAEVATLRTSWNDADVLFVGFKAGDNQESHTNLDLGTFVLDALGERWAVDLGADNYNLPDYWDPSRGGTRWTYYRMRAEAHNTLVFNPGKTEDQNPFGETKIIRFVNQPSRRFAVADLTDACPQDVKSWQRGVGLIGDEHVVVADRVRTKKPSEIYWFMHTPAKINLDDDGRTAWLGIGDRKLRVQLVRPRNAKFTVMDATPLSSSPNPPNQRDNAPVKRLTIHLENATDVALAIVFTPEKRKTPQVPAVAPLDRWR